MVNQGLRPYALGRKGDVSSKLNVQPKTYSLGVKGDVSSKQQGVVLSSPVRALGVKGVVPVKRR